ncbi:TraI domain-containing protein [Succinivibrio dextrinosolvens]|uniref:TraI domain-containing protein n=1 Tax=Succinivibrio dextrinosolvens TaxID=83771 RepID=UPI0004E1F8AC|nr:TraI domain-containing protein [Succinivibrio dextrinosolvens]
MLMLKGFFKRFSKADRSVFKNRERGDELFKNSSHCKEGPEDNRLSDYKLLLRDGSELFEVKSTDELIILNRALLAFLHERTLLDERIYYRYVKPVITTLVKTVFNAPASHVLHDSDTGGLLTHSLLTAVMILDSVRKFGCYDEIMAEDYERLEVFFLVLALMHDVGKIVSDYKITTPGGRYVFKTDDILSDNLMDFAEKHKATYLRYFFYQSRSKVHDGIFSRIMLQYLNQNPALRTYLSCVKRKDGASMNLYRELVDFGRDSIYFDVLKSADSRACCASISRFSSMYEAGQYLLSLFYSGRIDPELEGFYRLENGYLVEHGSPAYRALAVALDLYSEIEQKCQSSLEFYEEHIPSDEPYILRNHRQQAYEISPAYKKQLLGCDYESYTQISSDVLLFKRESFFKRLASSGFLVKKGYISCFNWNEVRRRGKFRYVYGFCINTGENHGDDCYRIVDLEYDRLIKLIKKSIRVDDAENITSFSFKNEVNLNKVLLHMHDPDFLDSAIDKSSLGFNFYSKIRSSERIRN